MRAALLGALVLAQAALAAQDAAFFARAEAAITRDEDFLRLHRGYLAYLEAHPALRDAERAWWDAVIEPTVGAAFSRFDEAVMGDATAEAALDAAYDLIARDQKVRSAVESLQRIEFTQRGAESMLADALRALRADPDLARRLIAQGGAVGGLAQPMRQFADYLGGQPDLVDELGGIFGALGEAPLAGSRLVPWWQQLNTTGAAATAYIELARVFAVAPRRFWAWHARELAWAEDAQARDWARYLYRRARRVDGLGEGYVHYLRALFAVEGRAAQAEAAYEKERGAFTAFPPKIAPPTLAPLPAAPTVESTPRPFALGVPRTGVRPARPQMPTVPKLEMRTYKRPPR